MNPSAVGRHSGSYALTPRVRVALLWVCVVVSGCTQFANRTIVTNGVQEKYFYAYGKFCGPGYPRPTDTKRNVQLAGLWPPVDDLDAICYAHDMCYASYGDHDQVCDQAVFRVANASTMKFARPCRYTSFDVQHAFLAKPASKKGLAWYQRPLIWCGDVLAATVSGGLYIVRQPLDLFVSDPEEGTCNVGEQSDVALMVKTFEAVFDKRRCSFGAKTEDRARFIAPIPNRSVESASNDPCAPKE